jgi:histidinol-phosphate aminotransferase
MGVYWNRRTKSLSPYVPGEQPRDRKFIKLNTNENPYPPSPKVIEALKGAAGEGLRLYPDPDCRILRETAAEAYGVDPEEVFAGNGSDEVLALVFAAFFEPASEKDALPVLFPDITYSFYPVYAGLWDIPFRTLPLGEDFSLNPGDYMQPCGGVIFPNPNAPTGLALPPEALLPVAAFQEERRRVVVLDEAYTAFGGQSAVPHIGAHPNLLTVHTLSKAASLAGLRVGFALGNRELIQGLCRIRDSFNSYTLDRLAQAGAAAALRDRAYYEGINRRIMASRDRVSAALVTLGFQVIPSSANFIFIRPPQKNGAAFFAALRDRGILVRHFDKPRIGDYLRVSIGTDEDMDVFLAACGELV